MESGKSDLDAWPHPFPDGWYLVTPGAHLRTERLIQKTWMGREIIAWRDDGGTVCVADAYCPHLGSHLGPTSGGTISAGNLVCPFHGFEFDATGRCVATPLAPPPKAARLKTYPVQNVNGFIFAYWDHAGRAPAWCIPELTDEWDGRRLLRRRLRAHPQITSENSVDFGHFGYIHGYHDLRQDAPTTIKGPCLTSRYSFTRHMLMQGAAARAGRVVGRPKSAPWEAVVPSGWRPSGPRTGAEPLIKAAAQQRCAERGFRNR